MNIVQNEPICLKQEVCDTKTGVLIPLTEILIHNVEERNKFVAERIQQGHSFKYIKGFVNNERMNVGMECNETGEQFAFEWGRRIPQEERLNEIMGDGFDCVADDPDIQSIGDGTEDAFDLPSIEEDEETTD